MTALITLPPDVERVLAAIRAAGGRPMLDGGFVRDSLMGITGSKDVDMEVYGISDPDVLIAALSGVGKVTEAGKVYGVIKVRAGQQDIDISNPAP